MRRMRHCGATWTSFLQPLRQAGCWSGKRHLTSAGPGAGAHSSARYPLAAVLSLNYDRRRGSLYCSPNILFPHLREMGASPETPIRFRMSSSAIALFRADQSDGRFITGWGLLQREPGACPGAGSRFYLALSTFRSAPPWECIPCGSCCRAPRSASMTLWLRARAAYLPARRRYSSLFSFRSLRPPPLPRRCI